MPTFVHFSFSQEAICSIISILNVFHWIIYNQVLGMLLNFQILKENNQNRSKMNFVQTSFQYARSYFLFEMIWDQSWIKQILIYFPIIHDSWNKIPVWVYLYWLTFNILIHTIPRVLAHRPQFCTAWFHSGWYPLLKCLKCWVTIKGIISIFIS